MRERVTYAAGADYDRLRSWLAGYIAVKAAAESRALTGLKATLPNGSIILYNGYVSLNQTPSFTKGQLMVVKATFSLQGLPIRYAS